MKDITERIDAVGQEMLKLRTDIIAELKDFIIKHGKKINGSNVVFLDSSLRDYMEVPALLSSENRMGDTYCYAEIECMKLSKTFNDIVFETEYDSLNASYIDIRELFDIYDVFRNIDSGEFENDIIIQDGTIILKFDD